MKPKAGTTRFSSYFDGLVVLVTLLLGLGVTLAAWRFANRTVDLEGQQQFEFRATQLQEAIGRRMLDYVQLLRGASGHFAAAGTVDRAHWRDYVGSLLLEKDFSGVQAIGYAARVLASERQSHIAGVRAEGFPDYAIWPEDDRPEYAPILYVEPFKDRNRRSLGRDLGIDAQGRAALQRATDTADAVLTRILPLGEATGADAASGLLVLLPVYRKGLAIEEVPNRRMAVQGHVFAAFDAGESMRAILGGIAGVRLQVFDGPGMAGGSLIYDNLPANLDPGSKPAYARQARLRIVDRDWTLRASSLPEFEAAVDRSRAHLTLSGGLLLTALVSSMLWLLLAQRTRMASEVREGREALELAMAGSNLALLDWNLATGEIHLSERWNMMLGYPAAATHTTMHEMDSLVHPDDLQLLRIKLRDVLNAVTSVYDVEYRVRNREGSWIWVRSLARVVKRDRKRGPLRITGTTADITERKHREATLKEIQSFAQAIVETVRQPLLVLDEDLRVKMANDSFLRTFRASKGVTEGTVLYEIGNGQWDLPELRALLADLGSKHAEFQDFEITRDFPAIGRRSMLLSARKLHQPGVERDRFLLAMEDITGRKEVQRTKDEFIATVNHELRTPLTALVGSLALLKEESGLLPSTAVKFLKMANDNADRLTALVNDILDIEKLKAGMVEHRIERIELGPFLTGALELNAGYAIGYGTRFELGSAVPDLAVMADRQQLLQVLANLLSNAAKHSPCGKPVVVRADPVEGGVRVSVADRGPGVPEEFRSRIFGKFAQADSPDGLKTKGTGLGLAISKALMESMGGEIGFESKTGEGATFFFVLPIAAAEAVAT